MDCLRIEWLEPTIAVNDCTGVELTCNACTDTLYITLNFVICSEICFISILLLVIVTRRPRLSAEEV